MTYTWVVQLIFQALNFLGIKIADGLITDESVKFIADSLSGVIAIGLGLYAHFRNPNGSPAAEPYTKKDPS